MKMHLKLITGWFMQCEGTLSCMKAHLACRNLIKTVYSKFVLTNYGIWTRKVKENETVCNAFWCCVEKAISKNPKSATFLFCHSSANMWISEQINQPESNNHVWIRMQMWHFKLLGGLLNNSVRVIVKQYISLFGMVYEHVLQFLVCCTRSAWMLHCAIRIQHANKLYGQGWW